MPTKPIIALDARLYRGNMTGDSTYWTGLIDHLFLIDHEFEVLLFGDEPCPAGAPAKVAAAWRHKPARNGKVWSLIVFPIATRQAEASIVHTQYSLPTVRAAGITTIHDISFKLGPEWFPAKDRLILAGSVPNSINRAAAVITVSETSKREIETAYPKAWGKIHAILNSASDAIQPVANASELVSRELGLDGPFILSVSTQWPRKNMQLAIDAVRLIPASMPHKLVLTGKAGWGELTTDPRVVLPGYVSTELLCALYSAADLYLCPSLHEGFGIPLVEAFRCGCPVICSSGGALPEVAGDAAAVMPDFRPETWSQAIQEILGDSSKLSAMKARGLERAKSFSWERSAQQHLEVYRQVLR